MMQQYRNKRKLPIKLIFNFLLITVLKFKKTCNLQTYINVIDIFVTATHLQVYQLMQGSCVAYHYSYLTNNKNNNMFNIYTGELPDL